MCKQDTKVYLKIHLWLSSTNMVTEIHMTYTCVSRILRFNYPLFSNSVAKYVCLKSNSLTNNIKHVYCKTAVMLSNCSIQTNLRNVTGFYVQIPNNSKFLQLIVYDQEIFYYDTKLQHTLYIKFSCTYNFLVSYQVT